MNPANPVIGVRSFSSDPKLVAKNVSAAVSGLQDEQVTATAKHFPGHGDTGEDSHYALPTITHTREQWERIDAPPFRAAIKAGVDAIMTAHISFRALEPSGDPATLSHRVLTGVLREELEFQGVIATDSLRMAGVREMYSDAEIPVRAIEAGADVLLDPEQPALQIQAVLDAVRSGRLTEERIDESVRRILIMKQNRGVLDDPLCRCRRGRLDRRHAGAQVLGPGDHRPHHHAGHRRRRPGAAAGRKDVRHRLGQHPGRAAGRRADRAWLVDDVAGHRIQAHRGHDHPARWPPRQASQQIVITTSAAWNDAGQRDLVAALVATGKPVLVVALRDAYDIAHLDGVQSYVATYSSTTVAVESALRVITGENKARGRLPVDITDPDHPDTVLYPFGTGLKK